MATPREKVSTVDPIWTTLRQQGGIHGRARADPGGVLSMPRSCSMIGWNRRCPITWRASWAAKISARWRSAKCSTMPCDADSAERAVRADLSAVFERDPACHSYVDAFLFYKGFHALESYRISHWLWSEGREAMALFLQSRISQLFAVDIHPAARIGRGIMLDHATGIVIGETAVVEDDVSIMQDVTLGGTGKESGDRHPKIRRGVLLSLGAKILGNIEVGEYSRVGAGSVVLKSVPPGCTAVGVPAKLVNCDCGERPSHQMDHYIEELPDNTG